MGSLERLSGKKNLYRSDFNLSYLQPSFFYITRHTVGDKVASSGMIRLSCPYLVKAIGTMNSKYLTRVPSVNII